MTTKKKMPVKPAPKKLKDPDIISRKITPDKSTPSLPAASPPPTRRDREIALQENELAVIKAFAGCEHQNTQITADERVLLSILRHDVAKNPWAVSQDICKKMGISFDPSEFELKPLIDFIDDFLGFGLPVDRLGRQELTKVLKAYFEDDGSEDEKPAEKMLS